MKELKTADVNKLRNGYETGTLTKVDIQENFKNGGKTIGK